MTVPENRITFRAALLGFITSGVFAALTVYAANRRDIFVTSTQIPVLPYLLLVALVLLVNPVCRLLRVIRPFTTAEILIVFVMGMVSSGISTFGLSAQLIPIAGSLFNSAWYNEQSGWNRHIAPYVNEDFFLAEHGIQAAAKEYVDATQQGSDAGALARQAEARARLATLESAAFAKVALFREGLPRELRAYPGILPTDADDFTTYTARLKRLVLGRRSLGHLKAAREAMARGDRAAAAEAVRDAQLSLAPLVSLDDLKNREDMLQSDLQKIVQQQAGQQRDLLRAHATQRHATRSERTAVKSEIDSLNAAAAQTDQARRNGLDALDRVHDELTLIGNVQTASERLEALESKAGSDESTAWITALAQVTADYPRFDATLRRFLLGDIPWGQWVPPLARWLSLILSTYLVLMALNVLIFRQWARHERLTYPLAELCETLAGANEPPGRVPSAFRSGLFWTGVAISGSFLTWNLICALQLAPGFHAIDFNFLWKPYIEKTKLAGLLPSARSTIFFTMIGLSFLIPRSISFSLWFFSLFYMLETLVLVWLGYGVNEDSFPHEWWYTMNYRTAQGGGALVVFSLSVLYTCRSYLLYALRRKPLPGLEPDESLELRVASAIFLTGSALVVFLLWHAMGAAPHVALFYFVIMILITVGLVRAVAEGGVLAFQAWANPFHFIRTIFGMQHTWTAPACFTPLIVYHAVLFLDVKTFIAPAMANALKVRHDLRLSRARFHIAIAACILVALGVALVTELMLSYARGANAMSAWFYTNFPQISTYGLIAQTAVSPPAAASAERLWIVAGAVGMGGLLALRPFLFWLPHPIGMIMLVNPLMKTYWFSIFIGWLAKHAVAKYGGKDLYGRARLFFIGLIFGELALVALAMLLALLFDVRFDAIKVDLNR